MLLIFIVLITVESKHNRLKQVIYLTNVDQSRQCGDVSCVVLEEPKELTIELRGRLAKRAPDGQKESIRYLSISFAFYLSGLIQQGKITRVGHDFLLVVLVG